MASDFLKQKAAAARKQIDKQYGPDAYGGSNYKFKNGNGVAPSSSRSTGVSTNDILMEAAKERVQNLAAGGRSAFEGFLPSKPPDLTPIQQEIEALKDRTRPQIQALSKEKSAAVPFVHSRGRMEGLLGPLQETYDQQESKAKRLESEIAALRGQQQFDVIDYYGQKMGNQDFAAYSQADTNRAGQDETYDYINNLGNARHHQLTAGGDTKSAHAFRTYDAFQGLGYSDEELERIITAGSVEANDKKTLEYMDEKEIALYNYLYHTQGKQDADDFLVAVREGRNARRGLEVAEGLKGNTLGQIAYGVPVGLDQFRTGVQQLFDEDAVGNSYRQFAGMQVREDLAETGPKVLGASLGQIGYDLTQTTANMAPSILLSAITGGFGGSAAVAAGVGSAALGSSAAGNAYNQAGLDGYEPGEARAYAGMVGIMEASLQYALGGISRLGGLTGKIADKVARIDNAALRVSLKVGGSMGAEGLEEGLQEILDPVLRTLVLKDEYDPATVEEFMYSFLLGALSAGVLEGSSTVSRDASITQTGAEFQAMGEEATQAIVETGLKSAPGTVSRQIAEKLQGQMAAGKTLGSFQLGQLYHENVKTVAAEEKSGLDMARNAGRLEERPDGWRATTPSAVDSKLYEMAMSMQQKRPEADVVRDLEAVKRSALSMGKAGAHAIVSMYGLTTAQDVPALDYTGDFYRYYHAGVKGNDFAQVQENGALAIQQKKAAYMAGEQDRIREEAARNAEVSVQGDAGLVENEYSKLFPKELSDTLHAMAKATGSKVEVVDSLGGRMQGFVRDGVIQIAADARDPVLQVMKHEVTHRLQELSPEAYGAYRDHALNLLAEEGGAIDDLVAGMQEDYKSAGFDLSAEEAKDELAADFTERLILSPEKFQEVVEKDRSLAKKILDALRDFIASVKTALGGKRRTAQEESLGPLEKAAELWNAAYLDAAKKEKTAQKKTAQEDGAGKYSLNPDFRKQFDAWVKGRSIDDLMNEGGRFLVGTTSTALQSIGVSNYKIFWNQGKLAQIMKKHSGMTHEVIKSVPEVLEHPIIVMQSQTATNRITLFGEVMDADKKPVLVALELSPQRKTGKVLDFGVIASAYGKSSAQSLIDQSDILYVDPNKKRTDAWLHALGLQLPSAITTYGSISSIARVARDVNGNISFGEAGGKTALALALEKALAEKNSSGQASIYNEQVKNSALRAELLKRVEKMTPAQIAALTVEAADTTPKLSDLDASGERGGASKFYESIQKSKLTHDELKLLAEKVEDIKYYHNISNVETLDAAHERLDAGGEAEVLHFMSMDPNHATAMDITEGFILLKRYQDKGDYQSAIAILKKLRQMGTRAGQTVQAFSILGKFTPEGMQAYAQSELDDAKKAMIKLMNEAWVEKRREMFELTPEEMAFIKTKMEMIATLPEGRDKNIALAEIAATIQAKLPTNFLRQVKGFARNAMLLNTKTMLRNVLGNTIMMPAYIVQDFVGAVSDKVISNKSGIRTTGLTGPTPAALKAVPKGIYESFDDWRRKINTRQASGDRFEIGLGDTFTHYDKEKIRAAAVPTKAAMAFSNALNWVDRLTGFLLDVGDRPYFEYHFINSLNNQLRLNGVSEPTAIMIDIATNDALTRTWQDDNGYTKVVSKVRDALNGGKEWGLGSIVVPFTKTPANLTKALVEYSPVGLLDTLTRRAVIYHRSLKSAKFDPLTQKAFVEALSKGITGTLVMVIGCCLANWDLISGGDDDKDKDAAAFEQKIMGLAPYSVTIGGKSYSYGWAQPVGGMFAITADFVQNLKEGNGPEVQGMDFFGNAGNSILNALSAGGNVLFEQSFMKGVQELFGEDNLMQGVINTVFGAGTQFVPTALSQVAQIGDPYARSAFEYRDIPKTALSKVKGKVPILRESLAQVVDVLGHDVYSYGGDNSLFNIFFNPANIYAKTATAAAEEIFRVYQAEGDVTVIPRKSPYYLDYKDKRYTFSAHERADFQRAAGRTNEQIVNELLKSSGYRALGDEEKAKVLTLAVDYSNAMAKYQYLKTQKVEYERDGWMEDAEAAPMVGMSVGNFLVAYAAQRPIDKGLKYASGKDMGETIKNSKSLLVMEKVYRIPGFTEPQQRYLFGSFGVGKTVLYYSKNNVASELTRMRRLAGQ